MVSKEILKDLKQNKLKEIQVLPILKEQKDILKFYKQKIPKGTTIAQAKELISKLSEKELDEWDVILDLYDQISDKDEMKDNEIKKVSFTLFIEIINEVKEKKEVIEDLDTYEIYNYALIKKPELAKK